MVTQAIDFTSRVESPVESRFILFSASDAFAKDRPSATSRDGTSPICYTEASVANAFAISSSGRMIGSKN